MFYLLLLVMVGCGGGDLFDCDEQVLSRSVSPDGLHVASAVSVQCGATTKDATWVLLSRSGRVPSRERDNVATFEGGEVDLDWDEESLQVFHRGARLHRMDKTADGVAIEYVMGRRRLGSE